jgi:hypothetical protein
MPPANSPALDPVQMPGRPGLGPRPAPCFLFLWLVFILERLNEEQQTARAASL